MSAAQQPVRLAVQRPPALDGASFDVVVVGGGITGAGVARHAAACGLRTLLLEANDFAAGTSSRSTKLIHGGLRYLAMGDIALVREGVLERKSLLTMAPHLTEPRWMLVPARGLLEHAKLRLGIGLYEWLGAVAGPERHRNWNADDIADGEPLLNRQRLPRACVYREYLTDDARLVLATLRAAAAHGAEICNYARVEAAEPAADHRLVRIHDQLGGGTGSVHARCVVNAAGPWVEGLLAGGPQGGRLHLSKGVHLVVANERLPVRNMVMMTAADGRPVFAIARGAVTYVGTTDTSHEGGPEHWPEVTAADIEYLTSTVNAHFGIDPLTGSDVLSTWAGLRPLIHQPGKSPREMSRRDEIWRDGRLVTVAGGKLTGFRKMAEDAMAAVGDVLGCDVRMPDPLEPVAGGDVADVPALVADLARRHGLQQRVASRLVRLYGSEADLVLGNSPTPLTASMFAEEVDWAMAVEGARTLEDVVYRRLRAAWFLPAEVEALAAHAGAVMAAHHGIATAEIEAQQAGLRRRIADEVGFRQAAAGGAPSAA